MDHILNQLQLLELEAKNFGFYWENASQIMQQIISEYHEIQVHLDGKLPVDSTLEEEIGDLLHATFSLCVFCHFHPEKTLRLAVDKFAKRFAKVKELVLQQGLTSLHHLPFDTLMNFWDEAKALTQDTEVAVSPLSEIQEASFSLDERLQSSCFTLIDWPLSRVLLKNHADYPWLILVPRKMHVTEMTELTELEQKQLMCEINTASQIMQRIFQTDKINVGALGNVVSQFHFHIVGRYRHDPLWPQGIWQAANIEKKYTDPQSVIEQLMPALSMF